MFLAILLAESQSCPLSLYFSTNLPRLSFPGSFCLSCVILNEYPNKFNCLFSTTSLACFPYIPLFIFLSINDSSKITTIVFQKFFISTAWIFFSCSYIATHPVFSSVQQYLQAGWFVNENFVSFSSISSKFKKS